ncbi:MAG TPA: hypothetical protein VHX66_15460 [Solirubrobacteraceae bacterium]|nr:hypothetical protein [Solirubrobacteraceae bacterium]
MPLPAQQPGRRTREHDGGDRKQTADRKSEPDSLAAELVSAIVLASTICAGDRRRRPVDEEVEHRRDGPERRRGKRQRGKLRGPEVADDRSIRK